MKLVRSVRPSFGMLFLAPAVNLALLLVFFVLLSGSLLLQPGIAVQPPASPFFVEPRHAPLVVSITAEPLPAIYFDDRKMTSATLGEALAKFRGRERSVVIKADRRAPAELVVAAAVRAAENGLPAVLATAEAP